MAHKGSVSGRVLTTVCLLGVLLSGTGPAQAAVRAPAASSSLVYLSVGNPQTLDPALDYETSGGFMINQVYETLVTYQRERTDQFAGLLADGWAISPDGLTYTFHLRQGVSFHDGHLLTAEDAAYSFWRGLLQGGSGSPQWLLSEPLLGSGIMDISLLVDPSYALFDNRAGMQAADPSKLLAACNTVKSKVTFDNASGSVVFHLAQGWSPFLVTLAGSWGAILEKNWVISKGGWDGNCATWQNFYAMQTGEDPLTAVENGTGPFKLDHWTPGTELVLLRNPSYWRTVPIWPGGPSGLAALQQVTIQLMNDSSSFASSLINGSADMADYIPAADYASLNTHVLQRFDAAGQAVSFGSSSGVLLAYQNTLSQSATDAFFKYAIAANSPYIGTGALGSGIPTNFFSDLHVRKAFNYAFDWNAYNAQNFGGSGVQRTGPIIKGVMGYAETQPHYAYNPSQANAEFALALGGTVAATGFTFSIPYNTGNTQRQSFCEILKAGVEALNPTKYHITCLGLASADYSSALNQGWVPIFLSGWQQDIPHPYNWVVPYLNGVYSSRQSLSPGLVSKYAAKTSTCQAQLGDAVRVCYEELQTWTYDDATDIFLIQGTGSAYLRAEVNGYYNNPALAGPYLYALSKGPLPSVMSVTPGSPATLPFNDGAGSSGSVQMPAGSVAADTQVVVTPALLAGDQPAGFRLGNLAFSIQAYLAGTQSAVDLNFITPVQISLNYTNASRGPLTEDSLTLFYWNGNGWVDATCGPVVRDPALDTISVPVCHFSKFALAGISRSVFAPILRR